MRCDGCKATDQAVGPVEIYECETCQGRFCPDCVRNTDHAFNDTVDPPVLACPDGGA